MTEDALMALHHNQVSNLFYHSLARKEDYVFFEEWWNCLDSDATPDDLRLFIWLCWVAETWDVRVQVRRETIEECINEVAWAQLRSGQVFGPCYSDALRGLL